MAFTPFPKKMQTASNPKAKPAKASPIQKVANKAAAMPAMPMKKPAKMPPKPMPMMGAKTTGYKNGGMVKGKAC